jgi:hypothetical protein
MTIWSMTRRILATALATAALLTLTACSMTSTWTPPAPPAADTSVTAALPTGAYQVQGELRIAGDTAAALVGYVEFGTADDGTQCQSEYSVAYLRDEPNRSVQSIRAIGGPTFYRDSTDPSAPGEWLDIADPAAQSAAAFLFIPAFIAGDFSAGILPGAGTGTLCSIPVIDRFMNLEGNTLSFDVERTAATKASRTGLWVSKFLTAAGLEGDEYDETAKLLYELSFSESTSMTDDARVTLDTDANGVVTLTQFKGGEPMVTLTLTPTTPRVVEAPGAPTYFERIAEAAKAGGVDAVLEDILG